jgi:hypothetical protein
VKAELGARFLRSFTTITRGFNFAGFFADLFVGFNFIGFFFITFLLVPRRTNLADAR